MLNPKSGLLAVIPVGHPVSKTGLEVIQPILCKVSGYDVFLFKYVRRF